MEDSIRISISYLSPAVSSWQAENVASTYAQTLQSMIDAPYQQAADIATLSPRNQQQINAWNSSTPIGVEDCVHDLFSRVVSRQPSAPAVAAWDGSLSYAELDDVSTRVAMQLVSWGIGPDDLVLLCFKKSMWAIVSMLGVLKAGGACVHLDPAHPPDRRSQIIGDTNAKVLLTSSEESHQFEARNQKVLVVDASAIDSAPKAYPPTRQIPSPSMPAFVIYTSGSTGVPKGVVLEHRSVCSSMHAHGTLLGIKPGVRVLQFAAYVFDISIQDIFTSLTRGACICVPSEQQRMDLAELSAFIRDKQANWMGLTPTVARLLDPSKIPTVKTLTLAGEAVDQATVDLWSKAGLFEFHNCYGPAECTIYCAHNATVGAPFQSASNIGRGLNSLLWVVNPQNYHQLVPVGAIGELVVEGPLVARGYHKDAENTTASFIINPRWADQIRPQGSGAERRMYKTGDLVRYNADGSLDYLGRKDTQIKIHGQRVELGDIEHRILSAPDVQNGLVVVPKAGPGKNQLVAVVAPKNSASTGAALEIVSKHRKDNTAMAGLSESLTESLPAYMVPTYWLLVADIPLNLSRKVDRARIVRWVEELNEGSFHEGEAEEGTQALPATETESRLQGIVAKVLGMPLEGISMSKSFIRLGGDSITAMQVVAKAREHHGLRLRVRDIMRSKSLAHLVWLAGQQAGPTDVSHEQGETAFDLSPMQQLYFDIANQTPSHYNQSFFVQLSRRVTTQDISSALKAVVQRHAMLRTLFTRSDGRWQQRVQPASSSYRLCVHPVSTQDEIDNAILDSQSSIDIERGPIFSVDVLNHTNEDRQQLFLTAHHLVIDLVSWRIILTDLQEILTTGRIPSQPQFSFAAWVRLQAAKAETAALSPERVLPFEVVDADYEYWGMQNKPNRYADVAHGVCKVDKATMSTVLSSAYDVFRAEPTEIFLAAVLFSFNQTFSDRGAPTIFTETHGRDTPDDWNVAVDLTETVGWFTALGPSSLACDDAGDVIEALRAIKDQRRKLPANGAAYFVSRFSNQHGRTLFKQHMPMELLFNYLGQYQQLEQDDSLFRLVPRSPKTAMSDVHPQSTRMALIEISVIVAEGSTVFDFAYNSNMQRKDQIETWLRNCETCLRDMTRGLAELAPQRTLSDFPLLKVSYADLQQIEQTRIQQLGISSLREVDAMYPTSPIQEGILLAQDRSEEAYNVHFQYEIASLQTGKSTPVDKDRLVQAWHQVVAKHDILRTVFIDAVTQGSVFTQVVLKNPELRVELIQACENEEAVAVLSNAVQGTELDKSSPAHRLRICQTLSGRTLLKLEISHALIDAQSMAIVLQDLKAVYETAALHGDGSAYSTYIRYLQRRPAETALNYWKNYVKGLDPCHLPTNNGDQEGPSNEQQHVEINLSTLAARLCAFCRENEVTMPTVFQAVWAVVLSCYTADSADVCFGYLSSGRDIPVEGINTAVGPFINMLVCRADTRGQVRVSQLMKQIKDDYLAGIEHQHCSLAEIQHSLGLSDQRLFNSIMTVRHDSNDNSTGSPDGLTFTSIGSHDPTEYELVVGAVISDTNPRFSLTHWSSAIPSWQAQNIAQSMQVALESFLAAPDAELGSVELVGGPAQHLIEGWNCDLPESNRVCVHDLIEQTGQKWPSAIAICAADELMTYRELSEQSSRLARYLRTLGVTRGTLVPICMEKSLWAILSMLAVMKAGGAYVPIDPGLPAKRQEGILSQLPSHVVLITSRQIPFQARFDGIRLEVSSGTVARIAPNQGEPLFSVKPGDPMYVLFTSGSTGAPKGVAVEHQSVATSLVNHGAAMNINSDSRVLQFCAFWFDVSVCEIFGCLLHGGCLCVPYDQDRNLDIVRFMNDMKVNWAFFTPSFISMIEPTEMRYLKTLVLGGETIRAPNIKAYADRVELINGYGPTEATIFCLVHHINSAKEDPKVVGRGVGCRVWVTRVNNPHYLAPLGSAGELLIEGPQLAREYLGSPGKTKEVFVEDLKWCKRTNVHPRPRRLYRTGDLVRYRPDGTLEFIGRRDMQAKVNGQRLELSEVEHYITAHVNAGIALIPAKGRSAKQLVAVVSLMRLVKKSDEVRLVDTGQRDTVAPMITKLQDDLLDQLPRYMVPTVWLVVEDIPLGSSGKLDRKRVSEWVEALSEEELRQAEALTLGPEDTASAASEVQKRIMETISHTLGLQVEKIRLNRSFISHGGDSITAMQMSARSRSEGIFLRVQDIIKSRTIGQLASTARLATENEALISTADPSDTVFNLSPIQQFFVEMSGHPSSRFNQSSFVRVREMVNQDLVRRSIESLVRRHSMLRARIVRHEEQWAQIVSQDISSSFCFHHHRIPRRKVADIMRSSQLSLDVERGPVLRVDLVQTDEGNQLLYMVAHHLVVDLVSWRIILQEIEHFLTRKATPSVGPLPFQAWLKAQAEHVRQTYTVRDVLPHDVERADFGFWGFTEPKDNVYGNTAGAHFSLSADTTSILVGSGNDVFGTDPVDIFLAALFRSFQEVFPFRKTPSIFIEGHGRESWDDAIDLATTVGWFTTLFPVSVLEEDKAEIMDLIRRTKDARRRVSKNGWPYFNLRYLEKETFRDHWPMEILFNYFGQYQQLERDDGLLVPVEKEVDETRVFDVDLMQPRLALIEVSATVAQGTARFDFIYPQNILRQEELAEWIGRCERILTSIAHQLPKMRENRTLTDFPLLSMSYAGLDKLADEVFPALGVDGFERVEDIYPCTPLQLGILLSHTQDERAYAVQSMWEAKGQVDATQLARAWSRVVDRHAILRTVFIESVAEQGAFDQLVLKKSDSQADVRSCKDEEVLLAVQEHCTTIPSLGGTPNRFTVWETDRRRVFCKLEVNHAIIDAVSFSLILRDLNEAYENNATFLDNEKPLYRSYVEYIQSKPRHVGIDYWKSHLEGLEPCYFPADYDRQAPIGELHSVDVDITDYNSHVRQFCDNHGVTLANLLRAAWGLVLRVYTGSSDVCFGYIISGRDIPVPGAANAVGPFINMLVSRVSATSSDRISTVMETVQSAYAEGLEHQHTSLADIQHALGLSGRALFNTILSIQSSSNAGGREAKTPAILFENIGAHDPTEVSCPTIARYVSRL
jgi:amino acid adenylation domain-containing protein/non-ribosomal peptide synthase protein (TIGR01720 family)